MQKRLSVEELFERWKSRQIDDHKKGGLKFTVQYIWPVDNPEYNVGMTRGRRVFKFFVPINHPSAHTMGFSELLEAAYLSESSTLSTDHNKSVLRIAEEA